MAIFLDGQEFQDGVHYEINTNQNIPVALKKEFNDLMEINANSKSGDFQSRFNAVETAPRMPPEASTELTDALKRSQGILPTVGDAPVSDGGVFSPGVPFINKLAEEWGKPHEPIPEGKVLFNTKVGPITEGDINRAIEVGLGSSGGGLTFAGVKAKSPQTLNSLGQAQVMEGLGKHPDEIWRDTGWMRGRDNRWRFEIDDSQARFKDNWQDFVHTPPNNEELSKAIIDMAEREYKMRGSRFATPEEMQMYRDDPLAMIDVFDKKDFNKYFPNWDFSESRSWNMHEPKWVGGKLESTLGEIYEHPELYKAYPELKDMKVKYNPDNPSAHAHLENGKQFIEFGKANNIDAAVHEIQHIIQGIEGFASGGGPAKLPRDSMVYQLNLYKEYQVKKREIEELRDTIMETGIVTKTETDKIAEFQKISDKYKEYVQAANDEAAANYMRLTGEIEARNSEARMLLDANERRKILPRSTEDRYADRPITVFGDGAWTTAYGAIDPKTGNYIKPPRPTGNQWEPDVEALRAMTKFEQNKPVDMHSGAGGIEYNLLGYLFGKPDPKTTDVSVEKDGSYPSQADALNAIKQGFGYGTGMEPYINAETARLTRKLPKDGNLDKLIDGDGALVDMKKFSNLDVKNKVNTFFAQAALAANRSAIASLGFDPDKMHLSLLDGQTNIAGLFDPKKDKMWINALEENKSTAVHESIHRGLKYLRENSSEAKQLMEKIGYSEEYLVRYLMYKTMGDPEKGKGDISDDQRATGIKFFETGPTAKIDQPRIERLEAIAAELFKEKRPGGPR